MLKKIQELKEKRAKLVVDQRALMDAAEKESRSLTTEEEAQYQNLEQDFEKYGKEIKDLEAQAEAMEKRKADLDARQAELDKLEREPLKPESRGGQPQNPEQEAESRAFQAFLAGGLRSLRAEEFRALQADDDVSGGFILAPQRFVEQIIKALDSEVVVRGLATVLPPLTEAGSLGAPSLDSDPDDAEWTSELSTGSDDDAMAFGKRELHPHPLAKRLKVSRTLLRRMPKVESLVRSRLQYKFGTTHDNAFLNGDGAQKPLGLFVASNNGISTSRDISADNLATSITGDGLINAKHSLKQGYRRRSTWLFHGDAVKQIRKLKDGDGQYLWQPGIRVDEPDTILSRPVKESDFVPNTFTTGLYVGMIADFSFYWIVDALSMQIQRLDELYAETNQVGFIGRLETDGMPVLEEAFCRVKLG